jgi:hypothetical protein
MSEVLKNLFGGSTSESNQYSQSLPVNETNPALSGLANPLSGSLSSLLQQWGLSGPQYSGQTSAPLTGTESSLLNNSNLTNPGADAGGYIKSVLNGNYMPGSPNGNPFLAATITAAQRPTLDNLNQVLTRSLPGAFSQAGQSIQANGNNNANGGSSAFDRAAALAYQSAANTSTDIASNIGSNAYNTGISQQEDAAKLDQNQVNTTVQALQAEALPRLIQQYGLDQAVSLFQNGVQSLLSLLQLVGGAQAPVIANQSYSNGSSQSSSEKGVVPGLFPKGI